MIIKRLLVILVLAFAILGTAASALALPEFIACNQLGDVFGIDVAPWDVTYIGDIPEGATECEYDVLTGRGYVTYGGGTSVMDVYNPNTGELLASYVHDFGALPGLEFVGSTLYGTFIGGGGAPSYLVEVDTTSAALAYVGLTGFGPISGLAYDEASGVMYGITAGGEPAQLVTIDLITGVATVVGDTGLDYIGSIEFGADGNLYGGLTWGSVVGPGWLVQIDVTNAQCVLVGDTGFDSISGLTSTGAPIPEPATMLLFGSGLLGLAGLGRKKFFKK